MIKIASTWEGIQAAKELEAEYGIHCNLTLLFSFTQAVACAEAGVTLISPFVGRILDWFNSLSSRMLMMIGIRLLIRRSILRRKILECNPFERFSIITNNSDIKLSSWVYIQQHLANVGASFRSTGEILELAGCDFLTISPALLDELQKTEAEVPKKLDANQPRDPSIQKVSFIDNEADFRYISLVYCIHLRFYFNEDQMAVEKLSEGIRYESYQEILMGRKFAADAVTLKDLLREKISSK